MGQKSNPNSFQVSSKNKIITASSQNCVEYAAELRHHFALSSNLICLFEKKRCLVKDCLFVFNSEKFSLTIFISFLVLKRYKRSKQIVSKTNIQPNVAFIVQKIFRVLSRFGYLSSKRIVLRNLNKVAINSQKTLFFKEHSRLRKELALFSREIYFEPGVFLFCLLNVAKKGSLLFCKFIFRFFRIFHKSKKILKFLSFLSKFVENIRYLPDQGCRIKGLKVQIKGRFSGVPRPKSHVFEKGSIPLQTISNKVCYSLMHANTKYGLFGIRVWVYE